MTRLTRWKVVVLRSHSSCLKSSPLTNWTVGLGEFIALACIHSCLDWIWIIMYEMRVRFHTQYKFLHIQMVVCSVLSLVTEVVCSVLSLVAYYMYLHAYNCIIVQCSDHCIVLQIVDSGLIWNTTKHMHTASYNGWKYSCNNSHHQQWLCML